MPCSRPVLVQMQASALAFRSPLCHIAPHTLYGHNVSHVPLEIDQIVLQSGNLAILWSPKSDATPMKESHFIDPFWSDS